MVPPLFLLSLCTLFFCLDTKEKVPKRKNQGCACPATTVSPRVKGQKLASFKQSAPLIAGNETFA